MKNERFDLVALELLDTKVCHAPLIEQVELRTFSAGDKIRVRQQHARFEPVRPRRHRLRRLAKLLDLTIRESIGICEDKNWRWRCGAAGLLSDRSWCRRVCMHRAAAEQGLAIEVGT